MRKMKRLLSKVLVTLTLLVTIAVPVMTTPTVTMAAVSWPSVSTSAYVEFVAPKAINVYQNTSLTKRGTCSPSKAYNASIAKNDVCYIYQITANYLKVNYPTSSGRRTGYVKRSDVVSVSAPSESIKSSGKATTYKTAGGASYGYTEKGDAIYKCGTSGQYTAVIYTAKSGARAYKFAWVKTADYSKYCKGNGDNTNTSYSLIFPLKGSITRSSSCKTNGQYCDYKAASGTAVYAPADGTVSFRQTYATSCEKLASYGNSISLVTFAVSNLSFI